MLILTMDDDFSVLRPLILLVAGGFALGVVLHACHEAAGQRARFEASCRAATQIAQPTPSDPARPVAAFRILPPESLPRVTEDQPYQ